MDKDEHKVRPLERNGRLLAFEISSLWVEHLLWLVILFVYKVFQLWRQSFWINVIKKKCLSYLMKIIITKILKWIFYPVNGLIATHYVSSKNQSECVLCLSLFLFFFPSLSFSSLLTQAQCYHVTYYSILRF